MVIRNKRDEPFIKRLNEIIEANLSNERFGVSELAREMNMSRSSLHRKVQSAYGSSVSQFIRQVRLDKAMELLKGSDTGVAEVAYQVGFGSPNYFSKCFLEKYGFSPSEIMEQEGDLISAEPDSVPSQDQTPKREKAPLTWMIAGLVVTLLTIILITISKPFSNLGHSENISIMVLPFHNDSPGEGDDYIINGLMEEILNKLAQIEKLDVVSRTTSEKYRATQKSSREIAREVRVTYILEGSAQSVHDTTLISLQLIEPFQDKHLWAKPYQREIKLSNLFDVREEVSRAVAEELKIVLNLHEEELIEKKPTENLVAYEAFLQATDLILAARYLPAWEKGIKLNNARRLLEQALEQDSSFVDAYIKLGGIYVENLFHRNLKDNVERAYTLLDTGYALAEKALQYDPGNKHALRIKGSYFQKIGDHQEAEKYIEASFKDRNRSYGDYEWEAFRYLEYDNYYPGIKSYLRFIELKPPDMDVPADLLHEVFRGCNESGFFELAQQHAEQLLTLTQDYNSYYWRMSMLERWQGKHRAVQEYTQKWWELDTSSTATYWWFVSNYIYLDEFDSAYKYMQLLEADCLQKGYDLSPNLVYGWVYLNRGQQSKADHHLRSALSYWKKNLELKTPNAQKGGAHFVLGVIYSIMDDSPNTLMHIEGLKEFPILNTGIIYDLKYLSCFDFVRNTPEFQSVLKHMEKTYRKEHNRIARMLRKENYPAS